jgi:hypothetical protein
MLDVTHVSAALISLLSGLYNFTQMRVRKQNCLITLSLSLSLSLSYSLVLSLVLFLSISLYLSLKILTAFVFQVEKQALPDERSKKAFDPKKSLHLS